MYMYHNPYDYELQNAIKKDKAIRARFQQMLNQAETQEEYDAIEYKMKTCPSVAVELLRCRMGMNEYVTAREVINEYRRRCNMMKPVRTRQYAEW